MRRRTKKKHLPILQSACRKLSAESLENRRLLSLNAGIADVVLKSSEWSDAFESQFASGGYPVRAVVSGNAPWVNLDQIEIRFDGEANVTLDSLLLQSATVGVSPLQIEAFEYDSENNIGTWKFAHPIPTDRYALRIDCGDLASLAGLAEAAPRFVFDVVQGDSDASGRTDVLDGLGLRGRMFAQSEDPEYSPAYDLDGSGTVDILDGLWFRESMFDLLPGVSLDASGPLLVAGLVNDTAALGATNSDGVTFDARLHGRVSDPLGVLWLGYRLGGGTFQEVAIAADGSFNLDPRGLSDGEHTIEFVAYDDFLNRSSRDILFILDTEGPSTPTVQLDPASVTGAAGDNTTDAMRIKLIGQAEAGTLLEVSPGQRTSSVDAAGAYAITAVPLQLGTNHITVSIYDVAGNFADATTTITREPLGSDVLLAEGNEFLQEYRQIVKVGPADGSRLLRFEIDAIFDASDAATAVDDLFGVYLVDPANPATTVLDRGVQGTSLFSLASDRTEFAAGLVRFDGATVEIDVSGVESLAHAELVLQLLNHDSDTGTRVAIRDIEEIVDDAFVAGTLLLDSAVIATAAAEVDLAGYTSTNDVELQVTNVRFSAATGDYSATAVLHNRGLSTGRRIVARFPGLPPGVQLANASGVDDLGAPYINFNNAVRFGGLGRNESSQAVELRISNPGSIRFPLRPEIVSAGPNEAPEFPPIGPLTVMPGDVLSIPLAAVDADGDRISYSLDSPTQLPNITLATDRLLIQPAPDQLGRYEFRLIATDGALRVEQPVSLDVVRDSEQVTRVTGRVLSTNETPLEGIGVQIGRFQTTTGSDGSFTLTLPSFVAPAESFDIMVPQGDPMFDPLSTGMQTIDLHRAGYDLSTGDSVRNPRLHQNLITAFLDGSVVYGADADRAAELRTLSGDGKLKVSAGNLLPRNDESFFPNGPLENENNGQHDPGDLFVAGDVRANDNVQLSALHTLLVREHNRKASEIALAYPSLSGDEIYQEARRWVGALLQHITYQEFLPVLLGEGALSAYDGYDPNVDPQISGVFSGAVFRIGHSMASREVLRLDDSGASLDGGALDLREAFFNPGPLTEDGIEPYLRGMGLQQAQEVDAKLIDALRNFLFGAPGAGGLDLISMNIQRGRDLGLPSYNQTRIDFGLEPAEDFSDISSSATVQAELASVYDHVDAVDLIVGGLAEDHFSGAIVGELFHAILLDQFVRTRDGDRYWYENGLFTQDELNSIRNVTLSSLILQNSEIASLPESVFVTGIAPLGPEAAGIAAVGPIRENRSIDGVGNNTSFPKFGSADQNLLVNYTLGYDDGVSAPAGADRPNPREVSNAVFDQENSIPSSRGATTLFMIWGQLLAHDLALTPGGTDDALKIHGESFGGPEVYPFVAEKLSLLFDHEIYPGAENVLDRPIYLPALEVVNGKMVDSASDTMVAQEIAPGQIVELFVGAGTLQSRDGTMFEGVLSVTEVPRNLTPAALPENLFPDTVVTIQPADMVFTTPAPLSFPNRAGWAPGTPMDLWSINPVTGEFEDVGDMAVSADGAQIVTTSGGVRNSSWHLPVPQLDPESGQNNTQEPVCGCEKTTKAVDSEVELGRGAYLEDHAAAAYQSLGVARGVTLRYDSERANPTAVLRFSFDVVQSFGNTGADDTTLMLLSSASFSGSNGALFSSSGIGANSLGLSGKEYLWSVPELEIGKRVGGSMAVNFRNMPTGVYEYTLHAGVGRIFQGGVSATTTAMEGGVVVVNESDSVFGSGWSIEGLQKIVEDNGGLKKRFARSVTLIDGDGSEYLFINSPTPGQEGVYFSPPGDFSRLEKIDGRFRRTMTDGTIYLFSQGGLLETVADRIGNVTTYRYSGDGNITEIEDPAGLITEFIYENGMVNAIVDPTGRTTLLSHDGAGALIRIADADASVRAFDYDARGLMTSEITPRGFVELVKYNEAGQFVVGVRADGSEVQFQAANSLGVQNGSHGGAAAPFPVAVSDFRNEALFVDGMGRTTTYGLGPSFLVLDAVDDLGLQFAVTRDESNLVVSAEDGNGNSIGYEYDAKGNRLAKNQAISVGGEGESQGFSVFGQETFGTVASPFTIAVGDVNQDDFVDIVTGNVNRGIQLLLSDGPLSFAEAEFIAGSSLPQDLELMDVNNDGNLDILGLSTSSTIGDGFLHVLLGDGAGSFTEFSAPSFRRNAASFALSDVNGDGNLDVVAPTMRSFFGNITSSVSVMLGDGAGAFSAPVHYAEFNDSRFINSASVELADVTGDGFADAVVVAERLAGVAVYPGNGLGAFGLPVIFSAVIGGMQDVEVADLDGDSDLDLVARRYGIYTLLNDGFGNFAVADSLSTKKLFVDVWERIQVADLDQDGNFEVVTADLQPGELVIVSVDREGKFFDETRTPLDTAPTGVAVFDADFDGVADVVTADTFADGGAGNTVTLHMLRDLSVSNAVLTRSIAYDPVFSQYSSITDELGRTTTYVVDPDNGNTLEVVRPGGVRTLFSYVAGGQLASTTDDLGRITRFEYDAFGRTTQITFALGTADQGIQRFEYDDAGNQTAFIDENNNRTEFDYDELNRLTLTRDPNGDATRFEYDEAGNLVKTTDARGNVTLNRYDERNRLTTTIDAAGGGTQFDYDKEGNLTLVVDPLGNVAQYVYDARYRLKAAIDPDGGRTLFTYDGNDNLTSIIDPVGNRTLFFYDARDRLIREIDPLGNRTEYAYDAADNLINKTDRNGRSTQFEYDLLDRLTTEAWVDGGNEIAYAYDPVGNLLSVGDAFSAVAFTYDARNRVKTVDNAGTPGAPNVVLTYGYDALGNVVSVSDVIDGLAGATTAYEYDKLNRTTSIEQSGSSGSDKAVDFLYNELGQFERVSRYSDLGRGNLVSRTDYAYDQLNRLTDLDHANAVDDVLAFYDHEYDLAGRITQIRDIDGATDYFYDDRSQLTGADRAQDDLRGDESYDYDANGNRESSHTHGGSYVFGDGNRLLSDGTYIYEYDNEGNMTRRTEIGASDYRLFDWDHRNRLVRATDVSSSGVITQTVGFAYDGLDRRILKTVDLDGEGTGVQSALYFVYDREDVILDYLDLDGPTGASPVALEKRYLHGQGIDEVLAQEVAGRTQWLLTDHLGTTRDVTSDTGAVLNHLLLDSYGNLFSQANAAVETRYLFTGREFVAELGLHYYRARFYDASVGLFISEDPIRLGSGTSHFYTYVGNAPLNYLDPSGLQDIEAFEKGVKESGVQKKLEKVEEMVSPFGNPLTREFVEGVQSTREFIEKNNRRGRKLKERLSCDLPEEVDRRKRTDRPFESLQNPSNTRPRKPGVDLDYVYDQGDKMPSDSSFERIPEPGEDPLDQSPAIRDLERN